MYLSELRNFPPENNAILMEDHKKTKNRTCPNCYYPMSNADTEYCSNCGQKYKTGRVSFVELISEAFSLLFNFDNKFFHTIGAILIPGRLTKQFFKGKHKSYVHPVRVLLVSTLVMIFVLNHTFDGASLNNGPSEIYNEIKKDDWKRKKAIELDTLKAEVLKDFNQNPEVARALDSLVIWSHFDDLGNDSIQLNKNNIGFLEDDVAIARDDIFNLTDEEIVDKYEVEGTFQRLVWRQSIRVIKKGDRLFSFFLGNILWLVVLMMPLFAFVLQLLYFRRDFYYVEHLVFAMHTHSFAFVVLSIYIYFKDSIPTPTIGFLLLLIGVFVILSMKRFYGQTWKKTVLKFVVSNIFYWVLLGLVLVLTLLLSLALF